MSDQSDKYPIRVSYLPLKYRTKHISHFDICLVFLFSMSDFLHTKKQSLSFFELPLEIKYIIISYLPRADLLELKKIPSLRELLETLLSDPYFLALRFCKIYPTLKRAHVDVAVRRFPRYRQPDTQHANLLDLERDVASICETLGTFHLPEKEMHLLVIRFLSISVLPRVWGADVLYDYSSLAKLVYRHLTPHELEYYEIQSISNTVFTEYLPLEGYLLPKYLLSDETVTFGYDPGLVGVDLYRPLPALGRPGQN